jgi:hypothetical protein
MWIRTPKHLLAAVLVCRLAVSVIPSSAQQPQAVGPAFQEKVGLQMIVTKYSATGPASLSAQELVEIYDFGIRSGSDTRGEVFFGPLVWSWAAERGIDARSCIADIVQAYKSKHGVAPDRLANQLTAQLADLPATGRPVYSPPSYVPTNVRFVRRRVYGLGSLPFGPIEKNGLSRRSIDDSIRLPL